MRVVKYREIPKEELLDYREDAFRMASEFVKARSDFGDLSKIDRQIKAVLWAAKGDLEEKTVLDLGCGATKSTEREDPRLPLPKGWRYHPWLCRALHHHGVRVIGADIGSNEEESFESVQTNLAEENSLASIPEKSVDIAHSDALASSPLLKLLSSGTPEVHINDILLPQLERILKPEGTYVWRL